MSLILISTAHPDFPFIFVQNREDYLHNAVAPADWWESPEDWLLSGRQLDKGTKTDHTWLGVTREGNISAEVKVPHPLLDDDSNAPVQMTDGTLLLTMLMVYRRIIDENYVPGERKLQNTQSDDPSNSTKLQKGKSTVANGNEEGIGGTKPSDASPKASRVADSNEDGEKDNLKRFNVSGSMRLCAGSTFFEQREGDPNLANYCNVGLNVVSFLGDSENVDIAGRRNETFSLTNVNYAKGETWPKGERGKELLAENLRTSRVWNESKEQLIERLFDDVLGGKAQDIKPKDDSEPWKTYLEGILKENIFIPRLGGRDEQKKKVESEERNSQANNAGDDGDKGNNLEISALGAGIGLASMTSSPPRPLPNPNPNVTAAANDTNITKAAAAPEADISIAPVSASSSTLTPKSPADSLATQFYGTTQQTIILVSRFQDVTFVERTLYDVNGCRKLASQGRDRRFFYRMERKTAAAKDPEDRGCFSGFCELCGIVGSILSFV